VQWWSPGAWAVAGIGEPRPGAAAAAVLGEGEPVLAVLGPIGQDVLEAAECSPAVQGDLQMFHEPGIGAGGGEVDHVLVGVPRSGRPHVVPAVLVVEVLGVAVPAVLERELGPYVAGDEVDAAAGALRAAFEQVGQLPDRRVVVRAGRSTLESCARRSRR